MRLLQRLTVTFPALRHTHVSQLIAEGLDVITVSRRIGRSKLTVTLSGHAHLLDNKEGHAADYALTGRMRTGHAHRRWQLGGVGRFSG